MRLALACSLVLGAALVATAVAPDQGPALAGRVVDASGAPMPGAVAWLHGAAAGTAAGPDGGFALPMPSGEDVLTVVYEGYRSKFYHVDRNLSVPLEVRLERAEAEGPRVVVPFRGVVPTHARLHYAGGVPYGDALRLPFEVGPGASGGHAWVNWSEEPLLDGSQLETALRIDAVHPASGNMQGLYVDEDWQPPLAFELSPGTLRRWPGAWELQVRLSHGASTGLAIEARVEVAHGPWAAKRVEGRPPEVVDGERDVDGRLPPYPGTDITKVAVTNETETDFEVVLEVARLDDPSPPSDAGTGVWRVDWLHGDARYFVAFSARSSSAATALSEPPEEFTAGTCSEGLCKRTRIVGGSWAPGTPGTFRFHVPKGDAGAPADGALAEGMAAVTFLAARDTLYPELAPQTLRYDHAEGTRAYAFGARQYEVPASAMAEARSAPAGTTAQGAAAALLPGLALVAAGMAAVAGATRVRSRRQAAPGAPLEPKYERIRRLGEGAGGSAHLARHRELGKLVAIKELHAATSGAPEARARALREARVVGTLRHPNVVEVYDVEEGPGGVAIVMEYVPGGSVADLLARSGGSLPPPRALAIWRDVLAGLEAVHAAAVVHRDVKPENILLTDQGAAKLADFGVARAPLEQTLAGSGAGLVGTPLYMAPEQLLGAEPTVASDLYAATAVAYRMLAGRPHLDVGSGGGWEALVARRGQRPRLPLPGVPTEVNDLLARGLAERPEDRPPGAAAMRAVLERAMPSTG